MELMKALSDKSKMELIDGGNVVWTKINEKEDQYFIMFCLKPDALNWTVNVSKKKQISSVLIFMMVFVCCAENSS